MECQPPVPDQKSSLPVRRRKRDYADLNLSYAFGSVNPRHVSQLHRFSLLIDY